MSSLKDKVAVVTGASKGIGAAIAKRLSEAGAAVVVNYSSGKEDADRVVGDIKANGGKAIAVKGDVAKVADVRRLFAETKKAFHTLDVLVNNAGVTSPGRADILEATEDSWDKVMGINLRGPFFLTQAAARLMRETNPLPNAPRAVINLSSISAFAVSINRGDYCITKAGIGMMTQLWAVRLAEFGISVFEIQPGVIESDMTGPVKAKYDALFVQGFAPINRWGQPDDIGRCVTAIARGDFPYTTGQVFHIDGGFHLRTL